MEVERKLRLDPQLIDRARRAAAEIAADVDRFIADRTTVAVERTVLRLMGMSVGLAALTAWGLGRFNTLRTQITLPDLPLSDPAYQQALTDALTKLTVDVLTGTFVLSAIIAILALCLAFWLKPDER